MNYTELANQVTARLVSQIETNPDGSWSMPWHRAPHVLDVRNAATDKPYRGVNVIALASTSIEHDYPTSIYATYRQWSTLGGQVRRGEKATQVILWVTPKNKDQAAAPADGAETLGGRRLVPVVFSVFNAAQVDNWTPATSAEGDISRDESADAFITATGADINHGHNHAAYHPGRDRIELPNAEQFHSTQALYATTLHELVHWTGHQSRLDRDLSGRFGDHAYAAEELVAELGAAIACAALGIEPEPRADHAHYLAHWLQILNDDPKALFATTTKAQAAVDHLATYQNADQVEAVAS